MKLAILLSTLACVQAGYPCAYDRPATAVVTVRDEVGCRKGPGLQHDLLHNNAKLAKGSRVTVSCVEKGQRIDNGPTGSSNNWYFTEFGCYINGGWFLGVDIVCPCKGVSGEVQYPG